jgi:hypothetical protein
MTPAAWLLREGWPAAMRADVLPRKQGTPQQMARALLMNMTFGQIQALELVGRELTTEQEDIVNATIHHHLGCLDTNAFIITI